MVPARKRGVSSLFSSMQPAVYFDKVQLKLHDHGGKQSQTSICHPQSSTRVRSFDLKGCNPRRYCLKLVKFVLLTSSLSLCFIGVHHCIPALAVAGGLGKRRQQSQGSELLPLNSVPTQASNNSSPLKPASLLSRITASISGSQAGGTSLRDSSKIANEV